MGKVKINLKIATLTAIRIQPSNKKVVQLVQNSGVPNKHPFGTNLLTFKHREFY